MWELNTELLKIKQWNLLFIYLLLRFLQTITFLETLYVGIFKLYTLKNNVNHPHHSV